MTTTLLITGFGPFPGASVNPSGHLVERLQRTTAAPAGFRLAFAVLPTEWQGLGSAFDAALQRHRPQLGLHFGYAANAVGFQLESSAYNEVCGRVDASGAMVTPGVILSGDRERRDSVIDTGDLARRLGGAGLPWAFSDDPGRYLCNNLYYRSLQHGLAALFVHIPALRTRSGTIPPEHDGAPALRLDDALRGARLIISALAGPDQPAEQA